MCTHIKLNLVKKTLILYCGVNSNYISLKYTNIIQRPINNTIRIQI